MIADNSSGGGGCCGATISRLPRKKIKWNIEEK